MAESVYRDGTTRSPVVRRAYTSSALREAASGLESDGLRPGPFRVSSSGLMRLTQVIGHGPETRSCPSWPFS